MLLLAALACVAPPTCFLLDGGAPGMDEADLAAIESECERAGAGDCDTDTFIGVDAALCIASSHELDDGISGLNASLKFHALYERPVWYVTNVEEEDTTTGAAAGSGVVIDAVSGALLEETGWGASP
ncbi:hypothetical protein LBMAG42_09860 [Deltaproteobacteria bacterium]|nr:hypothetical protein LBMAG42_09860 [Deltaproteobacteria bacterium]